MGSVMPAITLNACPGLSSFIGTAGTDALLADINRDLNNSSFFGSVEDIMSVGRQMFIENNIVPIRTIENNIKNLVGMFEYNDVYREITSEEDLQSIPSCMHDSILRYKPIKKLFDEARIFGFGWDYVPEEDCYGRLINNGFVEDVEAAMNDKGEFELEYTFQSDDPDLSFEELESIRVTRDYIDYILNETDIDPTDYGNRRS